MALFLSTTLFSKLDAAVILSFATSSSQVVANVNNQGSLNVSVLAAADSGTQTLRAYDLFVDIAPAGAALPSGWTLSTPVANVAFDLFSPSTSPSQGNVRASGAQLFSAPITLTTSPTTLWNFQISFDGNAGAVDGSYGLSFLTTGNFSLKDANSANIPFTINGGQVNLTGFTAIPEPSSILLVTGSIAAAIRVRAKRRKLIANAI